MPDFKNGKIYTIRHPDTDKFYIGSTCEKYLSNRFGGHKKDYRNGKNITSKILFDLGIDGCYIELLENYPCNSKEELHKREGDLIRLHKDNIVNRKIERRSQKEYREDTKEHKKEYDIKYNEDNKEKKKEQGKAYRELNKEIMKEYQKQYSQVNKEKIREKKKQYYQSKKLV
tara:strand:- start:984 stop:1499 length:516 start_codon:yes stop_codon:yes gene_type:complete